MRDLYEIRRENALEAAFECAEKGNVDEGAEALRAFYQNERGTFPEGKPQTFDRFRHE